MIEKTITMAEEGHNPYFNRWFSAIKVWINSTSKKCHNPYFNRWFSAIWFFRQSRHSKGIVTILILIDGFLQYDPLGTIGGAISVTILILIDGFLQ